jgi:acyl-CoA thioesterase FadM
MAAMEQNIRYKRELHPGDLVTVRLGILEIKEKPIRQRANLLQHNNCDQKSDPNLVGHDRQIMHR